MIKMERKLIDWQCKCGTVYALEPKVPAVLHAKHPERKVCRKAVGVNQLCENPFPDQEKRDALFNLQYGIIEV